MLKALGRYRYGLVVLLLLAVVYLFVACGGGGGPPGSQGSTPPAPPAPPPSAPTASLTANPPAVASAGLASTLEWSSTGANSCTASGGWSGTKALSGNESSGALATTTNFSITCTGAGGSASASATVTVPNTPPPPPAPTVSITANPTTVANGSSSTLTWSSTDATACTASGAWSGNQALSNVAGQSTGVLHASSNFSLSCNGPGGTASATASVTVLSVFPLRVEVNKRYLIDAQGNPFLMHGDTAWSLVVQLTDAEMSLYLDDRKARGFNTILVNLIERHFSNNAPNDRLGNAPFTPPGNFSTPNDTYFDRAASFVQKAADRDMLVLMTPAYLGFNGGSEGWYQDMVSSGVPALRAYGQYLAKRFAAHKNIMWLNGGDYTPAAPNRIYHEAVANGIRDINTTWPHSFHGTPGDAALDAVGVPTPSWLTVNNIYTQANNVHAQGMAQVSTMPYFLLEARYESEPNPPAPTQQLRAQAYEALLAGATGQIFGNNPIWHFQAPNSLFPYSGTWQTALNSPGSESMRHLIALWKALPWWLLEPSDGMIVAGTGHAARANNGSFALAYVTSNVTVQLDQLAGPVIARWYNPFTGNLSPPVGTFTLPAGPQNFATPGNNGDGTAIDWVLVLASQ